MKRLTNEQLVAERIAKDLQNHVVTERHNQGMYRSWRCQKPGDSNLAFSVTTWPGYLAYTGDMGDYVFSRTEDMIAFMRSAIRDHGYVAEKCVARGEDLQEFSETRLDEELREVVNEHKGRDARKLASDKCREIREAYEINNDPHEAMQAIYESNLWDGCDLPNLKVYTVRYLWCIEALKWFLKQLDDGRVVSDERTN